MSPSASDLEGLLKGLHDNDGQGDETEEALMTLVFRKNRENAFRFLRTPYSQRLVCLPQCLRSTAACQAEERHGEYICKRCGACKIVAIAQRARELGYIGTRVLKGGSILLRVVRETKPKAVLGISCSIEGVTGILACERVGVPAFCVPLLRSGCSDTDVDLNDVRSALEAALP